MEADDEEEEACGRKVLLSKVPALGMLVERGGDSICFLCQLKTSTAHVGFK